MNAALAALVAVLAFFLLLAVAAILAARARLLTIRLGPAAKPRTPKGDQS